MFAHLTVVTVWLAMLAWTSAIWSRSKAAWTAAFALYIVHILSAYESHYRWSHEVALSETARQTAEVTGWNSGIGLYFNYAFAAILAVDLAFLWFRDRRPFPRFVDGLVFFMLLNGAVVFGNGVVRFYGAILCAAIAAAWILRARGNSSPIPSRPR